MTREETIQVLAMLKAAYPNSYKNMTKDEANGTVTIWSVQFSDIPAKVILIAINKWISSNQFPPAISELKKKISDLYWESWQMLQDNKRYKNLTSEQVAECQMIYDVASSLRRRTTLEPTLRELTSGNRLFLTE